ncbi:MAG: glycosyltransferase family 4 protein [Kiritimatiellae bacterium]|nr:glycosyltransferase family 4 protein [Kiritimatiellia bacterium]
MKILFFSHYYSPEGNAPATRVSALCERWVKAGHDVTVITCAPNVPNGIVYDGYANRRVDEQINGVKVARVKTYLAANKGAIKRMFNFVSYFLSALATALFQPKPDVVIATSPQIFCGYAGVWYHRLRRVPLVVEIRDIWPESMNAVGAKIPGPAYKALEWIERALYRSCAKLVTVGEGYRTRLIEKGVPADKIGIVMNGTDLAVYKPQPPNAELLKKWSLDGKFVVSYIGTVGMACGLEVVLDAAEKLKDENVVFAIVGDGAHRATLEAEAKRRGLGNVVFTGRQPKSSMPDWVASSDANLVHLKKTELFTTVMPSKIFESAGCQRPIIMGVDGFAKKLVLDAGAGLDMTPESADSLVACVRELVNDPARCAALGAAAYKNIACVHNRDRQAEDYLAYLQALV